ncbi:cupin domain-containing protein [Telluribacter sp. SYSU D00476]|uniref:cupin domain-containing protein n=1 Tax=Telluribacter sp. SYSU D00476 TaxID=2811430 RepID=UPI001FF57EE1|nr:cupin domain-containing protein [Telluribacter sp. SYSU D00476]
MKSTLQEALSRLTPEQRFAQVMQHGTMSVELYAPDQVDPQQPHAQDELYVVVSGTGQFLNGEEVYLFGPGDVIFVPAGRVHRFFDFTDDFQTWVIFYGPEGGEKPKS